MIIASESRLEHLFGQGVSEQPSLVSLSAASVGIGRTNMIGFGIVSGRTTLCCGTVTRILKTLAVLVHGLQTKLRAQRSTACFVPVGGGGRSLEQ